MNASACAPVSREPLGVLYVAGYGRSGSTLLDLWTGQHPAVFAAGELMRLFGEAADARPCSCGADLLACAFWAPILRSVTGGRDGKNLREACRAADRLTLSVQRFPCSKDRVAYEALWRDVLGEIRVRSGCSVITDSSKSTRSSRGRVRALRSAGIDVFLIHLVRDLPGIAASVRRGSNRSLEGYADANATVPRAVVGWAVANFVASGDRRRASKSMCIRYADLADLLKAPIVLTSERCDGLEDHGIAGNRLRRLPRQEVRRPPEEASDRTISTRLLTIIDRVVRWLLGLRGANAWQRSPKHFRDELCSFVVGGDVL